MRVRALLILAIGSTRKALARCARQDAPHGPICKPSGPSLKLTPEIRSGEVDHLVTSATENGFHHVEGKALCHLNGDGGRHRKLCAIDDNIHQNRSVESEGFGDALLHFTCIFEPDCADAHLLGHIRKIRILELRARADESGRLLLDLDEAQGTVVEYDDLLRPATAPAACWQARPR